MQAIEKENNLPSFLFVEGLVMSEAFLERPLKKHFEGLN